MAYIFKENATTCLLAGSKFAIWKKPISGDKFGPYKNPAAHLDLVLFHSDLNYYGVAASNLNRVIAHPTVAGVNPPVAGDGSFIVRGLGQAVVNDHLLVTHNLGYVPKFFALYSGGMFPNGIPVQNEGLGRKRFVADYATTTEIRLFEVGYSSDVALSAVSRTYQVFAFRDAAPDLALPIMKLSPSSVIFGQGKFRSADPHLRAYDVGDSKLAIARSRTAAIRNGGLRAYLPDGSFVDFQGFNGSLPAPSFINLAVGL
jgi:hypothetical protein